MDTNEKEGVCYPQPRSSEDRVRIAGRLGAADVPVRLEVWPHMIHAWMLWAAWCMARDAATDAGETTVGATPG